MSNVFANFQIRRNESIDYGILKIISDVTKRGDRY
jgi:hypothetical protein